MPWQSSRVRQLSPFWWGLMVLILKEKLALLPMIYLHAIVGEGGASHGLDSEEQHLVSYVLPNYSNTVCFCYASYERRFATAYLA